jgi:hypothetical protein
MKSKTTEKYFNKIRAILATEEFESVERDLLNASNDSLEAFWTIVVAGYSVEFALINYVKLFEYLKDKPIEYSEALTTYATYPELDSGIYITKTKWFELN